MKQNNKKLGVMPLGIFFTVVIGVLLAYNLFKGDKTFFLSGKTSHGHYQIELKCNACHVDSFSSGEQMQSACESCHKKELEKVSDSHPKKVFLDPRNAELLDKLDARYCVSCHREHKPEITRNYGVTLAPDFCFHCHEEIAEERPSHKEFEFNSCANSGCHNFHDNSMLYEKFLTKHFDAPAHKKKQALPKRTGLKRWLKKNKKKEPLVAHSANVDVSQEMLPQLVIDINNATNVWEKSIHARTEGNCLDCHYKNEKVVGSSFEESIKEGTLKKEHFQLSAQDMLDKCSTCHKKQVESFIQSKHGMRLPHGLSAMNTQLARANVDKQKNIELTCQSCHKPHSLDVTYAAVDACLGCHQDKHSLAYKASPHFKLWEKEVQGKLPSGSGVSCASCHLPRDKKGSRVVVEHNQNLNLHPNSKMLRKVCMNCHGLDFSLSSLSDYQLIDNNFQGQPVGNHKTIELIKDRVNNK